MAHSELGGLKDFVALSLYAAVTVMVPNSLGPGDF